MRIPLAILATVLLAAGAAQAADDPNQSDLRCILGMSALSQNPKYKEASTIGSFYFRGRIEGRAPDFDFHQALKREMDRMGPRDYLEEAKRCGELLAAEGRTLRETGDGLKPRGVGR